jgi:hypothetical protein
MWWIGIAAGVIVGFGGLRWFTTRAQRSDLGGVSEQWLAQTRASSGEHRDR